MADTGKIRIGAGIQFTGKQLIYPRTAKLAGWQTDIVDHQQRR